MTSSAHPLPAPGGPTGPWPAPETVVLRGRAIRPGTPPEQLSRFGDAVWALQPAHPDAHEGVWAVHWTKFPAALVAPLKTMALTLLDHPVPATSTLRTGGDLLSVRSVGQQLRLLRVLAAWMDERGPTALDQLTDRHLDAYRDHVLAAAIPAQRQRDLLGCVVLLHSYRDLLPAPCRMATADPWRGARGDALVTVTAPGRVNKTPRIAPATMESLLAWSLRMLEEAGPDIADAWATWHALRAGEHPTQAGFAGLPIRDRLARFLAAAGPDTVLPGRRGADGRLVLDEYLLCRLLGLDTTYGVLRSGLQRRMAAASGLPLADGCPLTVPITGRIDGRPWRETPITAGELPDLVRVLTAALFTVVCYLSGMRPGEVLNLRRGCRVTDPATGELLLLGRRGKGAGRTPQPGPGPEDDELARPWTVVQPVHDAIALLERLTPHPLLFPPGYGRSAPRDPATSARSSIGIARDLHALIGWVNTTFTPADGSTPIPPDPTKTLHVSRFRRTFACARSVSDREAVRSAGVETRRLVSPLQLAGPAAA